jgi:hypothetical protein
MNADWKNSIRILAFITIIADCQLPIAYSQEIVPFAYGDMVY